MKPSESVSADIDLNSIGQISIFRDLTENELQQIISSPRRKSFAAGATLMMVEQSGEAVYSKPPDDGLIKQTTN